MRPKITSGRSTAFRLLAGTKCPYTLTVTAIELLPHLVADECEDSPFWINWLANECRRSRVSKASASFARQMHPSPIGVLRRCNWQPPGGERADSRSSCRSQFVGANRARIGGDAAKRIRPAVDPARAEWAPTFRPRLASNRAGNPSLWRRNTSLCLAGMVQGCSPRRYEPQRLSDQKKIIASMRRMNPSGGKYELVDPVNQHSSLTRTVFGISVMFLSVVGQAQEEGVKQIQQLIKKANSTVESITDARTQLQKTMDAYNAVLAPDVKDRRDAYKKLQKEMASADKKRARGLDTIR